MSALSALTLVTGKVCER